MKDHIFGLRYLLGALGLAVLGVWLAPIGLVFFWPALSLLIVGSGYLWLGPRVFRKKNGRVDVMARVLLGPYLFSQWAWRWKRRLRSHPADVIVPGLLLGRIMSAREAQRLLEGGVTAVLDLTCEHDEIRSLRRLDYRNVPLLDLTVPPLSTLEEAVQFVTERMSEGTVFVHCAVGKGRGPLIVAACLLVMDPRQRVDEVCDFVTSKRPQARYGSFARAMLERLQESRTADRQGVLVADAVRSARPPTSKFDVIPDERA